MKSRQDNDLTHCMDVVYAENYIELLRLSNRVRSMMKSKLNNDVTDLTITIYVEKETKLSWSIKPGAVCDKN